MRETVRVPHEERSRAMRATLMEALIECRVERGSAGMSTTLVRERAGMSRGAQLHRFPTEDAVIVAAVEHLTALGDRSPAAVRTLDGELA